MSAKKVLNLLLSLVVFCGLFAFSASVVKADNASVEKARAVLVRLIEFSNKQQLRSRAAQELLTGEMLRLNIASFGKFTEMPDKVLLIEKNQAVGRFQRFGENNQVTDVYFYLQFDGGWRVGAVRLLSLTGIIEQVYLGLKAKSALTEEEKGIFENSKLTLSADKELKTWFLQNRKALAELYTLLQTKGKNAALYLNRDDKKFPEAAQLLRTLNLSSASIQPNGNIEIVIGGITDNTVGFVYSPLKEPPQISPSSYIWVEEIAAGWYLFRTT